MNKTTKLETIKARTDLNRIEDLLWLIRNFDDKMLKIRLEETVSGVIRQHMKSQVPGGD